VFDSFDNNFWVTEESVFQKASFALPTTGMVRLGYSQERLFFEESIRTILREWTSSLLLGDSVIEIL